MTWISSSRSRVRAAGLWIGSVGGGDCVSNPTIVEFLNVTSGVIASERLDWFHPAVVFGVSGFIWDNKVFYGISSATPIYRIRVSNSNSDACDVISFDDVQFVPAAVDSPPVSDAGADFNVNEGQLSVGLDGTASHDPDGDSLTYSWAQLPGGRTVTLFGRPQRSRHLRRHTSPWAARH